MVDIIELVRRPEVLEAVQEKYLHELLHNNGPLDRQLAESTMRRFYMFAGFEPPKEFLWCESMEDGLVAATLIALSRLPDPAPAQWHNAVDSIMLARRMREEVINPDGNLTDHAMREVAHLIPSLADTCRVLRDRLGARGLLAMTVRTPFALETWFDAFACLEEEFEFQSPNFVRIWRKMVKRAEERSATDWRAEFERLSAIGNWILQASTSFWDWSHPPMLSGSLEAIYSAIAELSEPNPNVDLFLNYIRHCGWCWPFDEICIMAERPEQLFYVRDIDQEPNIEVRRLMLDLYGIGNYLRDTKARLIHKDQYGELYSRLQLDDEDLVVVKVINSTAEPDGTFREYFLRVPPHIRRAREAVAWSFGLEEAEYEPEIET